MSTKYYNYYVDEKNTKFIGGSMNHLVKNLESVVNSPRVEIKDETVFDSGWRGGTDEATLYLDGVMKLQITKLHEDHYPHRIMNSRGEIIYSPTYANQPIRFNVIGVYDNCIKIKVFNKFDTIKKIYY